MRLSKSRHKPIEGGRVRWTGWNSNSDFTTFRHVHFVDTRTICLQAKRTTLTDCLLGLFNYQLNHYKSISSFYSNSIRLKTTFVTFYFHFSQTIFSVVMITDTYKEKKITMKKPKSDFKDEKFKKYREALQWVFTDHKIETMDIKQKIHSNMKLVKRNLDWSSEQLFNYIMGQFVSGHGYLRHNKERHSNITVMLRQAESSLNCLLNGLLNKYRKKPGN